MVQAIVVEWKGSGGGGERDGICTCETTEVNNHTCVPV